MPIEVKAGKAGTLRSLHQFMCEKRLAQSFRFDLLPPTQHEIQAQVPTGEAVVPVSYRLTSLPLYAVECLPRLVDAQREAESGPGIEEPDDAVR